MGEYEPSDSRIVTNNPSKTPIEPERTGPREEETRQGDRNDQDKPADEALGDIDEHKRWQVEDAARGGPNHEEKTK